MFTFSFVRARAALIIPLMAFGLFAASPAAFAQQSGDTNNCASADNSSDPCFSDVGDILQGGRSLLPVDDLVVTYYGKDYIEGGADHVRSSVGLTKNSRTPDGILSLRYDTNSAENAFATGVGRMFNLPRDVIVTVTPGSVNILDQSPAGRVTVNWPLQQTPAHNGLTMADFNGDGFDDFVIAMINQSGGGFFQYVTAKDVNDPNQGLFEGPGVPGPSIAAGGSITSGDLDGDGIPEVIVIVPGEFFIQIKVYRFSRADSKIELAASTQLFVGGNQRVAQATILAGNFTGATPSQSDSGVKDQLAVVYRLAGQAPTYATTIKLTSIAIDVDKSQTPAALKPVVKSTVTVAGYSVYLANAKAGRLNWLSIQDQIVIGYDDDDSASQLAFYRISDDNALSITEIGHATITYPDDCENHGPPWQALQEIALGSYDQTDSSGVIEVPKSLQVAILYADYCQQGFNQPTSIDLGLAIYGVGFDDDGNITTVPAIQRGTRHRLSLANPDDVPPSQANPLVIPAALSVGDIQGRSLLLGPPTKATVVQHIQPDTILGVPPMQVGWVNAVGKDTQSVLNLSVYPKTYNAQYNFASSSTKQASRKSTTSFTYATDESAEEKISYGIPLIDEISVTLKQAAKQMRNRTVANTFNTYVSQSFRMDAQTVFDDLVAATITRLNIYTYPVIGHCIKDSGAGDSTATDNGSCPAGERPLMLQFSGPDEIIHMQPTEGAGLEWYQPPQQPGQVLSYPGSLAQLKKIQLQATSGASGLQLLSESNAVWGSQGAQESVAVNWAEGGGSNVSSGSTSTNSFSASESTSGSTNIEGVDLSGSVTFGYNQSRSASTLNTFTTSFADSQGVTLNRGLGADAPTISAYLYEGQAYIFGQHSPAGTIDDTHTPKETVKASGYITVGYAADPLSTSGIQSGDWWEQAYNLPDVALNHPQRWEQTTPQGTIPEQVAFNCPVGFSSSFASPECTPNGQTPTPANIATAAFYQMKGLFVTPGASTGGPQITRITAGDTVTLRARVYNYSLTNLPADSTVHVQFYAQPWDGQHGQFAAGTGAHGFAKAVFIGEDVLDPIPAFCGGSQQGSFDPCSAQNAPLNWTYATSTWDTGGLASTTNTYWKFWVVAFPESSSGGGLQEMYGHGLANVVSAPLNSLADVPIQTYSNNLGFYNQVFTVIAKSAPSPGGENVAKTLKVVSVDAEKDGTSVTQVQLNDRVQVRASHSLAGPDLDDVMVLFYDGDPAQGGKLFDMENVPRIPADGDFVTKVPFQPRSCGPHTLYVKAIPMDDTALTDINTASIDVTLDPVVELTRMRGVVQQIRPSQAKLSDDGWHLARQMKRQLLARLWAAQGLFRRGQSKVGMNRLNALESVIDTQRGKKISAALADALDQDINRLLGCLSV